MIVSINGNEKPRKVSIEGRGKKRESTVVEVKLFFPTVTKLKVRGKEERDRDNNPEILYFMHFPIHLTVRFYILGMKIFLF